jgi:uncharacterized protein (DUF433 family)
MRHARKASADHAVPSGIGSRSTLVGEPCWSTVQDSRESNCMSLTQTHHIRVDDGGVAWIDDTNVKVIEVVVDKLAHGSSAEEMHFQYPHLSLAQIYAALSYYHDHQEEFDRKVELQLRDVDALAAAAGESPARKRLREPGKLP